MSEPKQAELESLLGAFDDEHTGSIRQRFLNLFWLASIEN
jgi:hypothetical protein